MYIMLTNIETEKYIFKKKDKSTGYIIFFQDEKNNYYIPLMNYVITDTSLCTDSNYM